MSNSTLPVRVTMALVRLGLRHPRRVMWSVVGVVVLLGALMVRIQVDTDPENMLPGDHPVRELNREIRAQFGGDQLVVAGIVSDEGWDLAAIERIGDLHRELQADVRVDGDRIASVASIEGVGAAIDMAVVQELADAHPVLGGLVLTPDGSTLAMFVPIVDKDDAAETADDLERRLENDATFAGAEVALAGLPLAQDAFGAQMFLQMGLFAPLAGALIFLVMWGFFRRLALVVPAMAVAMLTVVATMGLLIGTGNTVHIMSSMIAIFLMPTAILDSVHVLSEFFDRYGEGNDRNATVEHIYEELASPLLFTTLTTIVGFASLSLAPIPPVRVFGVFVAVGMGLAWLFTVLFLPAYLASAQERRLLATLGSRDATPLARAVRALGGVTSQRPALVAVGLLATVVVAVPAIPRINVNDNPVRWFRADHEVRTATELLNERLPGTFGANLVLRGDPEALFAADTLGALSALEMAWLDTGVVGTVASVNDVVGASTGGQAIDDIESARLADPLVGSLVSQELDVVNVRLLLNDGDNQSMQRVLDATEQQLAQRPVADGVSIDWGGETYLNLVWQNEMVDGMLVAFLSTLAVVLVLLVMLFRSLGWAVLAMLPVAWTVLLVYGVMGWIGKDYDMPIAVLSTLVIGIGIDFAIHFVQRRRELQDELGDPDAAHAAFFEEPGRALTRNAAIVAIGFTPLLLSSLTPYVVVGVFLSSILLLSWLATVVGLPSLVRLAEAVGGRRRQAAR